MDDAYNHETVRVAEKGHGYFSTKTYEHNVGLSACFRQWRAESHCKYLHGYALKIKFVFAATELDVRNWAVDFGSLKPLKAFLEDMLDHKTMVAEDDPKMKFFEQMRDEGLIQLFVVPSTGCEATARVIFDYTTGWLKDAGYAPRISLCSVEVAEHGGNSAIYGRV